MNAYTSFAKVYDIFMDETPYQKWADRIRCVIETYGVSVPNSKDNALKEELSDEKKLTSEKNLVVDLGCGTGNMTRILSAYGYDMIGVDSSEEMLSIAMGKQGEQDTSVLYLLQDMRELELYSTVGTVVSVCDSLNYLLEEEELVETFKKINLFLFPKGIFIFDFNTVYKYETVIGDSTIAENRDDCSFIWENYYHKKEKINEYDLTLFIEQENGYYEKFEETHYQRGYTLSQMREIVEKAGMEWMTAIDADTEGEVTAKTERIFAVAREKGKEIK